LSWVGTTSSPFKRVEFSQPDIIINRINGKTLTTNPNREQTLPQDSKNNLELNGTKILKII